MTESWETESDAPEAQAGRIVSGLLRLANNEEAVRLLGVEGTLEEELDVTFLNDPLGWVANEIANGIKESDDEEEGSPLHGGGHAAPLQHRAGGAVDERELREAVVEFLQEDAG